MIQVDSEESERAFFARFRLVRLYNPHIGLISEIRLPNAVKVDSCERLAKAEISVIRLLDISRSTSEVNDSRPDRLAILLLLSLSDFTLESSVAVK